MSARSEDEPSSSWFPPYGILCEQDLSPIRRGQDGEVGVAGAVGADRQGETEAVPLPDGDSAGSAVRALIVPLEGGQLLVTIRVQVAGFEGDEWPGESRARPELLEAVPSPPHQDQVTREPRRVVERRDPAWAGNVGIDRPGSELPPDQKGDLRRGVLVEIGEPGLANVPVLRARPEGDRIAVKDCSPILEGDALGFAIGVDVGQHRLWRTTGGARHRQRWQRSPHRPEGA